MLSVQGPHKRPREEGPDSPDDEPQMSKRQVSIVSRAAERIYGPWVKTKHGPLAKQVVTGTLEEHPSRGGGLRTCSPGKFFKIKIVRIAICASKYNYHVIEPASHYAQESRYNNNSPLIDFKTL